LPALDIVTETVGLDHPWNIAPGPGRHLAHSERADAWTSPSQWTLFGAGFLQLVAALTCFKELPT
jgi:hypothetical protein